MLLTSPYCGDSGDAVKNNFFKFIYSEKSESVKDFSVGGTEFIIAQSCAESDLLCYRGHYNIFR